MLADVSIEKILLFLIHILIGLNSDSNAYITHCKICGTIVPIA